MKTIVLRVHPRAPLDVVNAVRDAALVSGLKLEDDASSTPLVPDLGE
jgi:hypothetical protein